MGKVTLLTIARELGVSRTTVSNAYSRPDQLSPELRDRILSTAERLGYRGPNVTARMLRTGRTGAIGLVFTEDLHFVFSDPNTRLFIEGVVDATSAQNVALTLLPVPKDGPIGTSAVPTAPVDGYLLFSVADGHPVVDELITSERPVVIVDEPEVRDGSFVGIDDRAGARLVGQHLAELGHRRVAVLTHRLDDALATGPVTEEEMAAADVRVTRERFAGYVDGLAGASVAPWSAGSLTVDGGRTATAELIVAHPDVTAIVCMTDQLAIGATQALAAVGRSVPGDVSVCGFDDIPRSATWEPALTTLRQPLLDKGRIAAELLAGLLAGGEPIRRRLDIGLVVRESTGPARR